MPELDGQIANAGYRLGATVGGMAQQEQQRIEGERIRLERQEEQRTQQLQTIKANSAVQTGLADAYDRISADVLSNKMDKVAATAAWKEASETIVNDNTSDIGYAGELVRAQSQSVAGQLQNRLFDTFRKRDQQEVGASINQVGEQLQRFAQTDPSSAVRQYGLLLDTQGAAAGLTPEQIQKQKQAFTEGVERNQWRNAAVKALQAGSVQGLQELETRLVGPEGDRLDPTQRTALTQQIFGWRQNLEARAEAAATRADRAQERQYNRASTVYNQYADIVRSGALLSPEAVTELTSAAAGTDMAPQVQELLAAQANAARFANRPAPERQAQLDEWRAQRSTTGVDARDVQLMNSAEKIDASLRKRVQEGDAWGAYGQAGGVAVPTVQIGSADQAVGVLRQRMATIGDVEAWAGQKVSPLQPQEAEAVQRILRTLKPDQQATLLGQVGELVKDSDRVAAIGRQIGDKDRVLGMAMLYANARTSEGRRTAELVLLGEQAIRDKSVRLDGAMETGWRGSIAKEVRGAFSNTEVEDQMVEAAFRIAAATNGDVSRAIRLATGGIVERNGGKIPLPYGMRERDFERALEGMPVAAVQSQAQSGFVVAGGAKVAVPDFLKALPDARLVHAGQGAYNVRAGTSLVTNEAGQRITIRVQP
jgi:hypothetical protein